MRLILFIVLSGAYRGRRQRLHYRDTVHANRQ